MRTTRYFSPAALKAEQPRLNDVVLPALGSLRHAGQVLSVRANGNMARGYVGRTLADIETLLLLGRQLDDEWSAVGRMVGISMRTMAYRSLRSLLLAEYVDATVLDRVDAMLVSLDPPILSVLSMSATAERWTLLDLLQRRRFGDLLRLAVVQRCGEVGPDDKEERAGLNMRLRGLGWGYAMKYVNAFFDRLGAIDSDSMPRARTDIMRLLREIGPDADPDCEPLQEIAAHPEALLELPPSESGPRLGRAILRVFIYDFSRIVEREARAANERKRVRLVLALRRHQLTHGAYPESLDRVAEENVSLPNDRFSGLPFHYGRTESAFRLYSVGSNGQDDGGLSDPATGADDRVFVNGPPPPANRFVIDERAIQQEAEQLAAGWRGRAAPDFTLDDLEGRNVSLSDFRGKVVLLSFWFFG